LEGPLRVNLFFFFPRPKSHYTKKGLRPTAPDWHTIKPDVDNAMKPVLDVLTKAGFWREDCQVCSGLIEKKYRPLHAEPIEKDYEFAPGVSIIIEKL
jgi:Holliday junction resolvase RusA-like endonuclease